MDSGQFLEYSTEFVISTSYGCGGQFSMIDVVVKDPSSGFYSLKNPNSNQNLYVNISDNIITSNEKLSLWRLHYTDDQAYSF